MTIRLDIEPNANGTIRGISTGIGAKWVAIEDLSDILVQVEDAVDNYFAEKDADEGSSAASDVTDIMKNALWHAVFEYVNNREVLDDKLGKRAVDELTRKLRA